MDNWYHLLTPTINSLSYIAMLGKETWIKNTLTNPQSIVVNEGVHQLDNTRYKEWFYFDFHTDDGFVVSCAFVLSMVKDHYFVWVYDPRTDEVRVEIERDADLTINRWGTEGLDLVGEDIRISGRADQGYHLWFKGSSLEGDIEYSRPIPGRAEQHRGISKTYYGLYQVPKMSVDGTLTEFASGETIDMVGEGYHDHWWGIVNRYMKWGWLQVKLDNGWVAGFYQGHYGVFADDLHRYAWLYRPGQGYTYFDEETLVLDEIESGQEWVASIEGTAGSLELRASARAERYEYKSVGLYGIPLGEVDYYQYPITAKGVFVDAAGNETQLSAEIGMLEWDWDSIW